MLTGPLPEYAELHALSNFSFQRGASHAEELAVRAASKFRAKAAHKCAVGVEDQHRIFLLA